MSQDEATTELEGGVLGPTGGRSRRAGKGAGLPPGGPGGAASGQLDGDSEARRPSDEPVPRDSGRTDRMDRVDPREEAEARKAEANLETEAMEAEVDTMMDLWNHDPRKGENSKIARERWTARLRSSPLGAEGRKAEPLCRRLEIQTGKTREMMTLPVKVQLWVLVAVFGTQWRPK